MTSKGKSEIISFSIPKTLAEELDNFRREMGYSKRSELLRDAIRTLIRSKSDLDSIEGMVEGILIILHDRCANNRVSDLIHENADITRSRMHSDFKGKCCDVIAISGGAKRIKKMVNELRVLNVERVEIFIA